MGLICLARVGRQGIRRVSDGRVVPPGDQDGSRLSCGGGEDEELDDLAGAVPPGGAGGGRGAGWGLWLAGCGGHGPSLDGRRPD
jgi:hypothetical protein